MKTNWADRDALITEMREIRFMERAVKTPEGMDSEVVQVPIAYTLIERMVGTMTVDPFKLRVPPSSETDKAQQQSSKLEKWTMAALTQLAKQADEDIVERAVECALADGHFCMRLLYAPQLWKGYPVKGEKQKRETGKDYNERVEEWKVGKVIPVSWQWVDPLNVYPEWGDQGLEMVLETDYRHKLTLHPEKFNILQEDPSKLDWSKLGSETAGKIKFSQLWTRDSVTYAVDGFPVHTEAHSYGRPPYHYGYGISTSIREPGKAGMSVLYPMRYLLPYLDRLLSQKGTAIRLWCWPTPVLRRAVGTPMGQEGQAESVEIAPGKMLTLWPGEEISFLTWEGNGPDADEMIGLVNGLIERAGISSAMFGESAPGDTGYLYNQLIAAARVKFKPIANHIERAMEQVVQGLWDIVEFHAKQPIYVWGDKWMGLGPDDLNEYRQVQVELQPMMPSDAYANSSQAINEVQAGIRSRRSAMEKIGIEQPEEMENEILVEQWKQRPEVATFLTAEAIKRAGLELAPKEITPLELMQMLPNLPPALQQAIMQALGMMAGAGGQGGLPPGMPGPGGPGGGGGPPGMTPGGPQVPVLAAPGVVANPGTPPVNTAAAMRAQGVPQAGTITARPVVGKRRMPSGKASGRAPGTKRRGSE